MPSATVTTMSNLMPKSRPIALPSSGAQRGCGHCCRTRYPLLALLCRPPLHHGRRGTDVPTLRARYASLLHSWLYHPWGTKVVPNDSPCSTQSHLGHHREVGGKQWDVSPQEGTPPRGGRR